jgi:predicted PurR-regulated permease PerM
VPIVGAKVASEWQTLAATSRDDLVAQATPYVRRALHWFAGEAGGLGLMVLHLLLTIIVTAILFATGETAAKGVRRFAHRLAEDRGEDSVILAGQAIRAVALGVVVTAIVQSAAAGLGLAIAGFRSRPC